MKRIHCRIVTGFSFISSWFRLFAAYIFGDLLYSLMVKNLRIENLPLYSLDGDVFLGVGKSLKELHFLNTKLTAVPRDSFAVCKRSFFFKFFKLFYIIICTHCK